MDKISYSLGVLMAQNLVKQNISGINANDLAAAVGDVLNGNDLKINLQDANQIFGAHMSELQKSNHEGAIKEGEAFFTTNGQRGGVTTTASGLQYEVITQGAGPNATLSNTVKVHYHGTLTDGTVFDSSVSRGEPISFPLGNVIKGWQEGLALMNVGSKYKLYIPYNLGYGDQGAGEVIKPYSALVFDVELLEIQ